MHWTPAQLARLAYETGGFRGKDLRIAVRMMLGESGGHDDIVNTNKDGSIDRGLWQFNTRFFPNISNRTAFDPYASTYAARKTFDSVGWKPWKVDNYHARFDGQARAAVKAAGLEGASGGAGAAQLASGALLALVGFAVWRLSR